MKACLILLTLLGLLLVGVGTAYSQEPPEHEYGHDTPSANAFHAWMNSFMLRLYYLKECQYFNQKAYESRIMQYVTDMVTDCRHFNNLYER